MNTDLKNLKPQCLWTHFAELCSIPHPSFHEEAIRQYILDFAKKNNLECHLDNGNNIIIRKPATPGMENRKGIVMQAHLDMVPQKNGDKNFDFEADPIEAYIDGEWVTANGTTLGADNGIGVAAMLAVFESCDLKHGPIEGLFTATEETGMVGAFGLEAGEINGEILMNLDSETEGELYVGCAGGLDANIRFDYTEDTTPYPDHKAVRVEIKGLKGGHSGIEIVLQRANANKVLFRILRLADKKFGIQLASVDGGSLRNAIPREATATVLVPIKHYQEFIALVKEVENTVISEFRNIEDSISISTFDMVLPQTVVQKKTAVKLIDAVCGCPNGVITMSTSMPGLVQTSTNLARVVSKDGTIELQCLLRSSVNSEKFNLAEDLSAVFELAGAKVELSGAYDGWNPNMESPILKTMLDGYEKLYGNRPAVTAIHAGLECGIIGGVYPNLDMISFGPTICFPHSPDEKVNIESVDRFWKFLCFTLETAPLK